MYFSYLRISLANIIMSHILKKIKKNLQNLEITSKVSTINGNGIYNIGSSRGEPRIP